MMQPDETACPFLWRICLSFSALLGAVVGPDVLMSSGGVMNVGLFRRWILSSVTYFPRDLMRCRCIDRQVQLFILHL